MDRLKVELTLRETVYLHGLLKIPEMVKLREDMTRRFAEVSGMYEKESLGIIGPVLVEGLIRKAKEMARDNQGRH